MVLKQKTLLNSTIYLTSFQVGNKPSTEINKVVFVAIRLNKIPKTLKNSSRKTSLAMQQQTNKSELPSKSSQESHVPPFPGLVRWPSETQRRRENITGSTAASASSHLFAPAHTFRRLRRFRLRRSSYIARRTLLFI